MHTWLMAYTHMAVYILQQHIQRVHYYMKYCCRDMHGIYSVYRAVRGVYIHHQVNTQVHTQAVICMYILVQILRLQSHHHHCHQSFIIIHLSFLFFRNAMKHV